MKTCWGAFYPDVTEFRQFELDTPRGKEHASVYMHYFFDNTGVAYVVDPQPPGAIRWFTFGCTAPEHTIHYCATCGHKAQFDSSD